MMIKFFNRGVGGGAGATEYVTKEEVEYTNKGGEKVKIVRDPRPEIMRGDPEITRKLIDSLAFKYKYTSGVVSFHKDDNPSEAELKEVMDRFEEVAFAGLEKDQYNILWVKHEHEGNVELHMIVPRVELSTQKSLNIAPPGHEKVFNALRDTFNLTKNWADPADPERRRNLSFTETYNKPKNIERQQIREEINKIVIAGIQALALSGQERITRADVINIIKNIEGLSDEVNERKNSITIKPLGFPEFSKGIKLSGKLYERELNERLNEVTASPAEENERANAERGERLARAERTLVASFENRSTEYAKRYSKASEGLGKTTENTGKPRQEVFEESPRDSNQRSVETHAISYDDLCSSLDFSPVHGIHEWKESKRKGKRISSDTERDREQDTRRKQDAERLENQNPIITAINEITAETDDDRIRRNAIERIREASNRIGNTIREAVRRVGSKLSESVQSLRVRFTEEPRDFESGARGFIGNAEKIIRHCGNLDGKIQRVTSEGRGIEQQIIKIDAVINEIESAAKPAPTPPTPKTPPSSPSMGM